jgi:predicted hydrocarbon binding protein
MALRMGGAKSGKEIAERLMAAGLDSEAAIRRVVDFMNHCKVGRVTVGDSIRIAENCEPLEAELSINRPEEPRCFFTTGFLNGLFSVARNQHVREVQCTATGDPFCEWEII